MKSSTHSFRQTICYFRALESILEMNRDGLDGQEMLRELLEVIREVLDVERIAILFTRADQPEESTVIYPDSCEPKPEADDSAEWMGGFRERVLQRGQSVFVEEIDRCGTVLLNREGACRYGLVCVPLSLDRNHSAALALIAGYTQLEQLQEYRYFLQTAGDLFSAEMESRNRHVQEVNQLRCRIRELESAGGDLPDGQLEPDRSMADCVHEVERTLIVDALKRTGGKIGRSAEALGITQRILRYKIGKLGIDYKHYSRTRRKSSPSARTEG